MIRRTVPALMLAAVLIAACGGNGTSATTTTGRPALDGDLIAIGVPLYESQCASCHGLRGEGVANWKTPNSDGSYPPPPHDATGHTWHHSDALLVDLIANGSDFAQTRMPAFGDSLSEGEILAILEYIKTWWGPEELDFQWEITQTGR